jgi:hypothetical protein
LAAIQCCNAAHVEIGRDRAARVAARLDATLDVRAQRLGSGECVSLVLFRLLGTAEYQWLTLLVDASRLGGGKRLLGSIADLLALVLGSRFAPSMSVVSGKPG